MVIRYLWFAPSAFEEAPDILLEKVAKNSALTLTVEPGALLTHISLCLFTIRCGVNVLSNAGAIGCDQFLLPREARWKVGRKLFIHAGSVASASCTMIDGSITTSAFMELAIKQLL